MVATLKPYGSKHAKTEVNKATPSILLDFLSSSLSVPCLFTCYYSQFPLEFSRMVPAIQLPTHHVHPPLSPAPTEAALAGTGRGNQSPGVHHPTRLVLYTAVDADAMLSDTKNTTNLTSPPRSMNTYAQTRRATIATPTSKNSTLVLRAVVEPVPRVRGLLRLRLEGRRDAQGGRLCMFPAILTEMIAELTIQRNNRGGIRR